MIVAGVIERLTGVPNGFAIVEGVAALSSIGVTAPKATPAAVVFVEEEAAEDNERVNAVSQRVEADFKVVVTTRDFSDATGSAASEDIEVLKPLVRGALVGWTPDGADDVITYVGARLVRAVGGYVTVEMTFTTAFTVRA